LAGRTCALAMLMMLGACGTPSANPDALPAASPLLRLSPAAMLRDVALQQRLTISARNEVHHVDVILEVDSGQVRLGLISLGRTAARLIWDGERLDETRAPWWPDMVRGGRILSDLQLV